jgi:hypothetical protein
MPSQPFAGPVPKSLGPPRATYPSEHIWHVGCFVALCYQHAWGKCRWPHASGPGHARWRPWLERRPRRPSGAQDRRPMRTTAAATVAKDASWAGRTTTGPGRGEQPGWAFPKPRDARQVRADGAQPVVRPCGPARRSGRPRLHRRRCAIARLASGVQPSVEPASAGSTASRSGPVPGWM